MEDYQRIIKAYDKVERSLLAFIKLLHDNQELCVDMDIAIDYAMTIKKPGESKSELAIGGCGDIDYLFALLYYKASLDEDYNSLIKSVSNSLKSNGKDNHITGISEIPL